MKKISPIDLELELIAITKQLLVESGDNTPREIKLDSSLSRHLGIDSLGRAELFKRIEKGFVVSIPDKLFAEAETLNDIKKYLEQDSVHPHISSQSKIITAHNERTYVDPSNAKTLIDLLLIYGENSADKTHIYFQNEEGQQETITYGELLTSSLRVAYGLQRLGLQEGETVAIMQPTHAGFFYTFLGTLLAGGIPVPIYPPFRMHMLEAYAKTEAHILRNSEVRVLVTFAEAEKLSRLLQAFVPSLKHVTTVNDLMQEKALPKIFKAKSEHFAFIQYTSGSTSDPKGVLLTHANLLANIRAYGKAVKVTPDDVTVSWLPLYHDMGLIGMWLGSLYYGVPLVLLTPFTFLNHPEKWLWAIHNHRGTLSGAPNFAYELCIRKIDPAVIEGLDLSSWRMAANGAEKVYPKTLEQFAQKFAPYGFKRNALLPVYGLAESTVGLAIPPVDRDFLLDHVDRKDFEEKKIATATTEKNLLVFVSCGHAIEGHEIRIVNDENAPLPERHVGKLQFRGPSSMQGYYNNPVATKAIYHEGWLDSGDLAYQAEGEIYITGRCKDLIIKAGRNIYPAEIEEWVGTVPGVRQGCVTAFGVSNAERGTDELIVVAESRETDQTKKNEITAKISEIISANLDIVPDEIVLVAPHTVPKTSSGKLQRSACKKMYVNGELSKKRIPPWLQITKLGTSWVGQKSKSIIEVLGRLIYTSYAALVFVITLIPMYLIVSFASYEFAAKACRLWAAFLLRAVFCPLKVKGAENLTKQIPMIYAANHASYIDTIVVLALVPAQTKLVGKKELLSVPILRTFMRKLKFLAVDRFDMSKGLEDAKQIEEILKTGSSILIFPEGTFSYATGLRPFRLGAFKIAVEAGVPICPIALQGTRTILRADEKLMRPGRIHVTISEPVYPSGNEWQAVTQLRNAVRAQIASYCGEPSLDFIAAQIVAPKPPHA